MKFIGRNTIETSAIEFFLVATLSACGLLALAYVACMIVGVTP